MLFCLKFPSVEVLFRVQINEFFCYFYLNPFPNFPFHDMSHFDKPETEFRALTSLMSVKHDL